MLNRSNILALSSAASICAFSHNESDGFDLFAAIRSNPEPILNLALWNNISSFPYTFDAWESLLDPGLISTSNGVSEERVWASEHILSAALLGWHHWNFSIATPIHSQGMWGLAIDDTQLGLGDTKISAQHTHSMTKNEFWLAGIGIGITLPTSTSQLYPRTWIGVDRSNSTVYSQTATGNSDLCLSIASSLDLNKISNREIFLDASWNYQIGGFFGNELYKYGERVRWALASQWIFLPTWNLHAGFWGDRDLAEWSSNKSASAFGLGLQKQHKDWSFHIAGDWGIDNPTSLVTQDSEDDRPSWQGQSRMVGDFEFALGLSYKINLRKDSDLDGVVDALDLCPLTPKGRVVITNGCEMDSDHDSIVDALDKCPTTPIGRIVDPNGCEFDSDHDGVVDAADQCPSTPAGIIVDSIGCNLDPDLDGLTGVQDLCPTIPESPNGYQDEDGCPDELPAMAKQKVLVLSGVNFQKGSDILLESSKPILDTLAQQLNDFPGVKVEVAGHTSSEGKADKNIRLSTLRAQAVVKYLLTKEIAAERISAKGYGSSAPIADNKTESGREKNRRVEFRRVN